MRWFGAWRYGRRSLAASAVVALLLAILPGTASAQVKYWYGTAAGYDASGRATLRYCAAVKRRSPGSVVTAAGIAHDGRTIPYREWPRTDDKRIESYQTPQRFPFSDWYVLAFRPNGTVYLGWESGAVLRRVGRGTFRSHCW